MRTVKIDYNSGSPKVSYDGSAIGIQGEHRASELVIVPPLDMPSELSYRLAFDPGGQSDTLSLTDGELRYELPQSITRHEVVSMNIEGYEGGDRIYKSVMVELYFDEAVDTDNPVDADGHSIGAEVAENTAARHTHNNKDILDRFGETDGQPTYNGEPIGGGSVGDITAEDVAYTYPDMDMTNAKETFDEIIGEMIRLVQSAHTHDNKSVLDKLSVTGGKLQYDGSDVGLKGDKGDKGDTGAAGADGYTPVRGTDYWTEADKAEIVDELKPSQVTSGTSMTLADNTEYRLTDVTELTITYPDGNFECWMRLAFATEGAITVTLPATTQYIGTAPDFKNGETWELSIKDGIVIAGKVA